MALLMTNFDAIIKKYLKKLAWEYDVKILHETRNAEILQLCISWGPNNEDLPEQVVIKQPKNCVRNVLQMHNNEFQFYNVKKACGWTFGPTCYGADEATWKNKGTIMLEDLTLNYTRPDFVDGLTLQQSVRVVDCLAKIHAECFINPEIMDPFIDDGEPEEISMDSVEYMQRNFKEFFPQNVDSLIEKSKSPVIYDVMEMFVHGDMDLRNLFYPLVDAKDGDKENSTTSHILASPALEKFDDLKSSSQVAIVDWSHVRRGLFTEDIADLLASNMPPNVRRKYTALVLKHYHAQIVKHTKLHDVEPPFSLTDLVRAYDAVFPIFALKTTHRVASYLRTDKQGAKLDAKSKIVLAQRAASCVVDACAHK